MIPIPPDAECCMIPVKYMEVLRAIAHGPFLPIDFPLPIVVSKMVPDDEIWFCKTTNIMSPKGAWGSNGDIEILKKEKIDDTMFTPKPITDGSQQPKQLCTKTEGDHSPPNGSYTVPGTKLG
jgi:hypothetical protein